MTRTLQFAYIKDERYVNEDDLKNSKTQTKAKPMLLKNEFMNNLLVVFICIVFGIGFSYVCSAVVGIITKCINYITALDQCETITDNNVIVLLFVRYFLLYLIVSRLVAQWNHNSAWLQH